MSAKQSKPKTKPTVKKRTLNPPSASEKGNRGAPFNEQDPQRRLGGFTTAGEHARVGGRHGIIGQTTKKSKTDKKGGKK